MTSSKTRTGKPVHPGYGQPPAGFYVAAVERERPATVWLVFEDHRNPAVVEVTRALRGKGIDVRMQSASLGEDLHVLLSAPKLVVGAGTFGLAAAALSTRLDTLYLFGQPPPSLTRLGFRIISAIDSDSRYSRLVLADWRASADQLELMRTYPASAIVFDSSGDAVPASGRRPPGTAVARVDADSPHPARPPDTT